MKGRQYTVPSNSAAIVFAPAHLFNASQSLTADACRERAAWKDHASDVAHCIEGEGPLPQDCACARTFR